MKQPIQCSMEYGKTYVLLLAKCPYKLNIVPVFQCLCTATAYFLESFSVTPAYEHEKRAADDRRREKRSKPMAYTAHTCQTSDKSMEKGIFIDNKKKKKQ